MPGLELPESPRVREALGWAMKRLAARSRLSFEIARGLLAREYSEPEIEEVLSYLLSHKLLDDKKAIQSLIEERTGRRSIGKGKIRAELERRGVPDEIIEAELAEWTDGDEAEAIWHALTARAWTPNGRAKAGRFLIGRGFDEALVESALERFFGAEESCAE